MHLQIFSPKAAFSQGGFLCSAEVFSLMQTHLPFFLLLLHVFLESYSRSYCPEQCHGSSDVFFYVSYNLGFTFTLLIHFVCDVRKGSSFILLLVIIQCPQHWRNSPFPPFWSLDKDQLIVNVWGLFLGSLFCLIAPYVCLYGNTKLFQLL
jgi:hypothetical protein